MTTTSSPGNRPFVLLRGGRDDDCRRTAPGPVDRDWQAFCQRIGWQQLSEPALPDSYEDDLAARIFGRRAGDSRPLPPLDDDEWRPSGVRLRLAAAEAVPLNDSTRAGGWLEGRAWLLVAAAAALVIIAGATLVEWASDAPAAASAEPIPAPEVTPRAPVTPGPPAPPAPESAESAKQAPYAQPAPPPPHVPSPGSARRAALARRASPAPAAPSRQEALSGAGAGAEHSAEPPWQLPPAGPVKLAAGALRDAVALADAEPSLPLPGSVALAPSASHLLAALDGLPAPAGTWAGEQSPSLALPLPSWVGVNLTAPRETSGIPAGVRVIAQLDLHEAGRALLGQL